MDDDDDDGRELVEDEDGEEEEDDDEEDTDGDPVATAVPVFAPVEEDDDDDADTVETEQVVPVQLVRHEHLPFAPTVPPLMHRIRSHVVDRR